MTIWHIFMVLGLIPSTKSSYLFNNDCVANVNDPHYTQHHRRCIELTASLIVGYMVVFCAMFLKLPTLISCLKDKDKTKEIKFRVLFSEALLNVTMASFCLYFHSPFYRFGEHFVLLTLNTTLLILCMMASEDDHRRLHFFLGLQVLLVLAIIFFLEDVELFILEICPYVTICSVLSFKLPHIYDLMTTQRSPHLKTTSLFLAIGMNSTRLIMFVVEEIKDIRPYLANFSPLVCNIVIVGLYYFYVKVEDEENEADQVEENKVHWIGPRLKSQF